MQKHPPALRWFALLMLFCTLRHAGYAAGNENALLAGVTRFRQAYAAWDRDGLEQALRNLEMGAPGTADAQRVYWQGVVRLHLILHALSTSPADRLPSPGQEAVGEAQAILYRLLDLDPGHGEAHALLATLYGLQIGSARFGPWRYGRRFQDHMRRALDLAPDNPRVHYLAGRALEYTPPRAGHPAGDARHYLERAERLFSLEQQSERSPLDPDWGHDACLVFLGLIHERERRLAAARKAYTRALEINPKERRAREALARLRD